MGELVLLDITGQPAVTSLCSVQTPAGKKVEGRVLGAGSLVVSGIAKGNCSICFPEFDEHRHEAEVHPGDKIPKPSSAPGKRSGADTACRI